MRLTIFGITVLSFALVLNFHSVLNFHNIFNNYGLLENELHVAVMGQADIGGETTYDTGLWYPTGGYYVMYPGVSYAYDPTLTTGQWSQKDCITGYISRTMSYMNCWNSLYPVVASENRNFDCLGPGTGECLPGRIELT